MLADNFSSASVGRFDENIQLPGTFLREIVQFIAACLPAWRDDPLRQKHVKGETRLTNQLCKFLNTRSRAASLDHIIFYPEEPDPTKGGRTIDLAASPKSCSISINGRRFSYYDPLMPIECKRLPTPDIKKRERREYLHTRHSTTGGVQRFKAGLHGADFETGAMIGYVQSRATDAWMLTLNYWVRALAAKAIGSWVFKDAISTIIHDPANRTLVGRSVHSRSGNTDIELWHLLVEM